MRPRLALALLLVGFLPAPGSSEPAPGGTAPPHPRQATRMKREWGVEILGVRPTAAGYMLELRYRVIDPEKAAALFDRRAKPELVDDESGARFSVPSPPTTGEMRNSNPPLAGHTYWMLFANPGGFVKPGRRVSVLIGDFRAAAIVAP